MTNPAEMSATLDGLDIPDSPHAAGSMEKAIGRQVDVLRRLGYIEDHHAGQVELALHTARDVDRSFGKGAPSGRANLLRVMNEILESLPHPEAASRDKLDEVVQALLADDDDTESVHHRAISRT